MSDFVLGASGMEMSKIKSLHQRGGHVQYYVAGAKRGESGVTMRPC